MTHSTHPPAAPSPPPVTRICDRCGNAEWQHTGPERFCPFLSTFRAETPDAWRVEVTTPGDDEGMLVRVYFSEPIARRMAQWQAARYPHHVIAVVPLYRRDTR